MQKVICSIRRKLVLSIMLIALAALGVFMFAACSDDYDVFKEYPVGVTYDFQGGSADNKTSVLIHVKENSYIPAPVISGKGVRIPSREGYSFAGFYLAETDENGDALLDTEGNISVTDTQWDFDKDKVADKSITLCAKWWKNYTLVVRYGKDYLLSSEIEVKRNADGSPQTFLTSDLPTNSADYTILSYKYVKDSTAAADLINTNYAEQTLPDNFFGDGLKANIWAESLEGEYRIIRSARDLSVSTIGEAVNYYLLADIDLAESVYNDEKSSVKIPNEYNGKFVGNGHTISNFTLNLSSRDISCDSFGLFRSIGSKAEITDVTFKNVTLNYDLTNSSIQHYYLGTLAGQISAGAVVKDVKIVADNGKNNTLEYMIREGVSQEKIVTSDDMLIGQENGTVELQGACSALNVKLIASTAVDMVDADDEKYTVYVKYTVVDGAISFGEDAIYDFAVDDSLVTILNLTMPGKNTYSFSTYSGSVYNIVFATDNGVISATISKN